MLKVEKSRTMTDCDTDVQLPIVQRGLLGRIGMSHIGASLQHNAQKGRVSILCISKQNELCCRQ